MRLFLLLLLLGMGSASAAPKTVRVFVALCDNKTQGIIPVGENNTTQAIVLCCLSDRHFRPRLERLGYQPLFLTQQLMYPGSFRLHDVLEVWKRGASSEAMRLAAGRADAKNQRISVDAGTNIFAPMKEGGGTKPGATTVPERERQRRK